VLGSAQVLAEEYEENRGKNYAGSAEKIKKDKIIHGSPIEISKKK
jgi:hypothetical protein